MPLRICARIALLLTLLSSSARPQMASVGWSAGVPVPTHSRDGEECFITRESRTSPNQTLCGPDRFFSKPYALGPIFSVHLPHGFSVQAGVLYERFHMDVAHGVEVQRGSGTVLNFGQYFGASANAWLFPMLLGYSFRLRPFAPFVHAGATLRHLGVFTGTGIYLDQYDVPVPASFHIDSGRGLDVADTIGAGVRYHVGPFDMAPEIQFLHWTSGYYQPAQNQAMFMLSFSFPTQR
jgi:hypothetical protein